ncbi:unnamed protein product [Ectocarpus sp. CCAP 1310/34]|nr:unnamed protein product [Ectocarpus sp. CCAP 1310/34]
MKPMPPATFVKGASLVARQATFDPLRGAFVVLARPNDPELNLPERRRGLGAMGLFKDNGLVKDVLSEAEGRQPFKLPKVHKRRPPPGIRLTNDLGTVMQMNELTANEKAALWSNYERAMERFLQKEGDLESVTWRHRVTHEPAPPWFHHRWPTKQIARAPPPYGTEDVPESLSPAAVLRSGRRACKSFNQDQGERLLTWKEMKGDRVDPPPQRKLPPSYEADDAHMDAMMDDERSMRLAVPMHKQRRHVPGQVGEISGAIRPIGDRERRELRALETHEFTVPKKPTPPPPAATARTPYLRPSHHSIASSS